MLYILNRFNITEKWAGYKSCVMDSQVNKRWKKIMVMKKPGISQPFLLQKCTQSAHIHFHMQIKQQFICYKADDSWIETKSVANQQNE